MMWRLTEGKVRLINLEGEALAYHYGTGQTHFVSPLAGEVLQILDQGPTEEEDLFNLLREGVADADSDMLATSLKEAREQLKSIALVDVDATS
jgi:PqqD family protein of HPr-rel-A system